MGIQSPESFQVYPGGGVEAEVNGASLLLGSPSFLKSRNVPVIMEERVADLEQQGMTVVILAMDGVAQGVIGIADEIRPEAPEVMKQLRQLGMELVMITGDNRRTAAAIARQVGIERYLAEVRPEEKGQAIEELKKAGKSVAMVGDGINDAPALAAADVGIAMGSGSDIAIESADVALMSSDLHGLVRLVRLARMTMSNVRQNLFWALAYNTLGIPVAALGFLAPWLAGAAMALSSVSVTLNALRLQRFASNKN